jgi:hypothetical protein
LEGKWTNNRIRQYGYILIMNEGRISKDDFNM